MPETRLFGKHRVRATFYHIGALLFIGISILNFINIISTSVAYVLTSILFIIDYLAEMYDPHPANMEPWYKTHFHGFFKDDTED